jgi:hypothetical protein
MQQANTSSIFAHTMNNSLQEFDKVKKLGLAILVLGSLALSAQAQTPPLSLPPIPGAPGNTNTTTSFASPIAPIPLPPGMAGQPAFKNPAAAGSANALPPLPSGIGPLAPGGSDRIADAPAPAVGASAALPPPPSDNDNGENDQANAAGDDQAVPPAGIMLPPPTIHTPIALVPGGSTLPEVKVAEAPKTWLTRLRPVMKPRKIDFDYRRQILPSTIYRKAYDPDNQHLPPAVYAEDYDHLFLAGVAANNIDATRALLDTGRNVNLMNAEGDTALTVALTHGAADTARLLVARGADPMLVGASGRSAYDVAAATGQTALLPVRPLNLTMLH